MKLLVVEDDLRIAQYLKKGLELSSYVVDSAHDGTTGFDLASSETYDVIILDQMLPEKDGLSICRELRADGVHTPILMLTAKSLTQDKVTGLDAGADDYLAKPFVFDELLARIRALARRPQNQNSVLLSIDSLTLNPTTYQVTRAGHSIELTKKEYALLEFLVRHAGQVFSATQLVEQVWNYDADVTANAVQVYIGYLRTKIDKKFPQERSLLQTVRGFGYKLDTTTHAH